MKAVFRLVHARARATSAPGGKGDKGLREALELAEDVLSRAPFSTQMWPNGMHPNTGIERIRAALAAIGQHEAPSRFERAYAVARMLHTNLQIARGAKGLKAWKGDFVEREYQALVALARSEAGGSSPQAGDYVLAPREPTDAMLRAAYHSVSVWDRDDLEWVGPSRDHTASIYTAMIAASPSPATVGEAKNAVRPNDLLWLKAQRQVGHCSESNFELRERRLHNKRIDRLLTALQPAKPDREAGE